VPAVVGLPPNPGDSATYRIGAHDLLKIEVFAVEELSSEERVHEDGTIALPLVGSIVVGGLTPREAEQRISEILGRSYLQDPQVHIFVSEYASQNVTVTGAVKKPGVFPMKGPTTLLQAIAMAEGIDELANTGEVIVFRGQGGSGTTAYVVDVEKIEDGSLADPLLIGDDRVVVPKSGTKVFFDQLSKGLRGFVSFGTL
jgi:polysaccharide export outer membrane protein